MRGLRTLRPLRGLKHFRLQATNIKLFQCQAIDRFDEAPKLLVQLLGFTLSLSLRGNPA
jgi:hypothetical protein